jgi:predicted ester cyclase
MEEAPMAMVPHCAKVLPLFAGGPTPTFIVPLALAGPWRRLADSVRCHVGSYLGDTPVADGVVVAPREAPATFAEDLARGAPGLHAAFPDLVRRVTAIDDDGGRRVTIRVACEGTHDGAFFGFMMPTGRAVQFEEIHHLRVEREQLVEDRLELDLRAIIRQLGAAGR